MSKIYLRIEETGRMSILARPPRSTEHCVWMEIPPTNHNLTISRVLTSRIDAARWEQVGK